MNCLGVLDLEEVLPFVGPSETIPFDEWEINASSLRLQTFKYKGTTCVGCGIKATHFSVDRQQWANRKLRIPCTSTPHFNLYATNPDGSWRLMTQDHIVPLSLNGQDSLDNSCTMCTKCNGTKQAGMPSAAFMLAHGGVTSLNKYDSRKKRANRKKAYAIPKHKKECHHVGQ